MLLQAWQCFFIVVVAFTVIGFIRGWRREILSLAFTLTAILIISLGGGYVVAQALFVRLPLALQDLNNIHTPGPPTDFEVNLVAFFTLVALIVLGYLVGNRAFPKPTAPVDRVWGLIPGIISGIAIYAMFARMSTYITKGPNINLTLPAPSQDVIGNYLLLIFVVVIVLVIIGLVASSAKKSGAPPKKS